MSTVDSTSPELSSRTVESFCSWSSHLFRGPLYIYIGAGPSSSRATCPNTEMRRRDRRYGTVKSDRSVVVVHHFKVGCTIGFQAAVSDTSGGKHPESTHQLIVRSRCLRRSNTDKTSVLYIRSLVSSVRRLSLHIRFRDVMTAQERPIRRVRSGRH